VPYEKFVRGGEPDVGYHFAVYSVGSSICSRSDDQQEALRILGSSFPKADEIKMSVYRDPLFFDQGESSERIKCPFCEKELDNEWFGKAMNRAYGKKNRDLRIKLLCCGKGSSLNDLTYEWPAGFARFVLEARNPLMGDPLPKGEVPPRLPLAELRKMHRRENLETEKVLQKVRQTLERILKTELRRIWARY
jgi:hypothetical protein